MNKTFIVILVLCLYGVSKCDYYSPFYDYNAACSNKYTCYESTGANDTTFQDKCINPSGTDQQMFDCADNFYCQIYKSTVDQLGANNADAAVNQTGDDNYGKCAVCGRYKVGTGGKCYQNDDCFTTVCSTTNYTCTEYSDGQSNQGVGLACAQGTKNNGGTCQTIIALNAACTAANATQCQTNTQCASKVQNPTSYTCLQTGSFVAGDYAVLADTTATTQANLCQSNAIDATSKQCTALNATNGSAGVAQQTLNCLSTTAASVDDNKCADSVSGAAAGGTSDKKCDQCRQFSQTGPSTDPAAALGVTSCTRFPGDANCYVNATPLTAHEVTCAQWQITNNQQNCVDAPTRYADTQQYQCYGSSVISSTRAPNCQSSFNFFFEPQALKPVAPTGTPCTSIYSDFDQNVRFAGRIYQRYDPKNLQQKTVNFPLDYFAEDTGIFQIDSTNALKTQCWLFDCATATKAMADATGLTCIQRNGTLFSFLLQKCQSGAVCVPNNSNTVSKIGNQGIAVVTAQGTADNESYWICVKETQSNATKSEVNAFCRQDSDCFSNYCDITKQTNGQQKNQCNFRQSTDNCSSDSECAIGQKCHGTCQTILADDAQCTSSNFKLCNYGRICAKKGTDQNYTCIEFPKWGSSATKVSVLYANGATSGTLSNATQPTNFTNNYGAVDLLGQVACSSKTYDYTNDQCSSDKDETVAGFPVQCTTSTDCVGSVSARNGLCACQANKLGVGYCMGFVGDDTGAVGLSGFDEYDPDLGNQYDTSCENYMYTTAYLQNYGSNDDCRDKMSDRIDKKKPWLIVDGDGKGDDCYDMFNKNEWDVHLTSSANIQFMFVSLLAFLAFLFA